MLKLPIDISWKTP